MIWINLIEVASKRTAAIALNQHSKAKRAHLSIVRSSNRVQAYVECKGEATMTCPGRRSIRILSAVAGCHAFLLLVTAKAAEPCPEPCSSKISLGIVVPKTGQEAASAFGAQVLKPVEIAVRELNATGGIGGVPVDLAVVDDQCEPSFALRIANRLVEQNRRGFVIGPTCPAAAMAAAPIFAQAGVIQFLPTVSANLISAALHKPHNAFSMVASDDQEAQALGSYLKRAHAGKKLSVVYTDAFYRRGIVELVRDVLPDDMKQTAHFEPLLDVSGMYDRVADKLQRDRPDIIYMALDHWPLVQFVEKLRKRGVNAVLMGGQRILSYNFWLKGRDLAEGIQVIVPIGSPATPELRKTIDLLKRSDVISDLVALNSYASVQVWAEALRRAGSRDPYQVSRVLRSEEFQTAVGPVAFDKEGKRRDLQFSILVWQEGRPKRLE